MVIIEADPEGHPGKVKTIGKFDGVFGFVLFFKFGLRGERVFVSIVIEGLRRFHFHAGFV